MKISCESCGGRGKHENTAGQLDCVMCRGTGSVEQMEPLAVAEVGEPVGEDPAALYARIRPTMDRLIGTMDEELSAQDAYVMLQLLLARTAVRNGLPPSQAIEALAFTLPRMMAMWSDAYQPHNQ